MDQRAAAIVACLLLLSVGCAGDGDRRADNPPSPTAAPEEVGIYSVAGDCDTFGRLRGAQVSFLKDGRVYVARPSGDSARCISEVDGASALEWGPEGDRVGFGDLRRDGGTRSAGQDEPVESADWSRPTGTSFVYIVDGRLMKVDAFGDMPFEISFLADHDEVVYHPAGTHLAVTGTAEDGTYGVWLATNVGEERQLLAVGEDARRIYSLSFEHDGTILYYAAEHEDRYDLHALHLALQDEEGETRDAELVTADSADAPIADVVASEFIPGEVAYTVGSCEDGKKTRVRYGDGTMLDVDGGLAELSTEPVGWLPNAKVLVLARPSGCHGDADLYLWSPNRTTLLVPGVEAAGVRGILPPAPGPPGSRQEVIA